VLQCQLLLAAAAVPARVHCLPPVLAQCQPRPPRTLERRRDVGPKCDIIYTLPLALQLETSTST
jgi:hypothetical protein